MITKGLKLIHVNTRSIFKKIDLLENMYIDGDVICCSETWLDSRIPNSLVCIKGMKIFRNDRKIDIPDYNVHIIGGGVCIFVAEKWIDYTTCISDRTFVTKDFEIITVTITRLNSKKLFTASVYKPPRGHVENLVKFMSPLIQKYQKENYEIWILGDFNIYLLKRDNPMTVTLSRFAKKLRLSQKINTITRPNVRGGSCIDLIMTDCLYGFLMLLWRRSETT